MRDQVRFSRRSATLPFVPIAVAVFLHGTFQPHLDHMQHTRVHDAPRERQYQFGVWNGPEVVREVGVHDVPVASEQRAAISLRVHADEDHVELQRGATGVKVAWPSAAADCAAWLRELLQ